MQILVLSYDICQNAAFHPDAHVIKLCIEAAQIASAVHWLNGDVAPYRLTHRHHPLVQWAQTTGNYDYVVRYGLALAREYAYRFGRVHLSEEKLLWLDANRPVLSDEPWSPLFCANHEYDGDVASSYRSYLIARKSHVFRWTRRTMPVWARQNTRRVS